MKISCNCIVKNEENWLWYSLMSVLNYVDEINIIDTGSSDNTPNIIRSIHSPKIKATFQNQVTAEEFTSLRQKQLEESASDWILLLDGDEIWTPQAIEESISEIKSESSLCYLINPFYMCIGDVFHIQPESAGNYFIGGKKGHITLRWFKKNINGIKFSHPYGKEGLFIENELLYQTDKQYKFIKNPYFHTSHLSRSSSSQSEVIMRTGKYKYELGHRLSSSEKFPLSFYLPNSIRVSSPWSHRSTYYFFNSIWQTPLKTIKRKIVKFN